MYVKHDINYTKQILKIDCVNVIKLEFKHYNKTFIISAIYRPPSTCPLDFTTSLRSYLMQNSYCEYNYLIGDINIDIKGKDIQAKEYCNTLAECGYISLINKHTRITNTSSSCIDHIYIKSKIRLKDNTPIILKSKITDYYTILNNTIIKHNATTNAHINKNRVIAIFNEKRAIEKIKAHNIQRIIEKEPVEIATQSFIQTLQQIIHESTTNGTLPKKEIKRKEWITKGLIKSVNKKQELFTQARKFPNSNDIQIAYKKYKNSLNTLIKIAKRDYYAKKTRKQST